ncbi:MAG: ISL3 family transposase [Cyanobacteria bacterium J06597_1]
MELIAELLPSQANLELGTWDLDRSKHQLTISITSIQPTSTCPICGSASGRIHSHYERTLEDLPCVGYRLTLFLDVRKFYCPNPSCKRQIFCERIPDVAVPWGRQTCRLSKQLSEIALALGGAAGARLEGRLGYGFSRDTLLRKIKRLKLPSIKTPRVLGVDDFAFRRNETYGTILVDLEKRQPVEILPDRKASTLANWLREHPGVEVLSRDRSNAYRCGMSEGAPQARQVADRFHLLQNLAEHLERALNAHRKSLKEIERQLTNVPRAVGVLGAVDASRTYLYDYRLRERIHQYQQVHSLRKEGHQIRDIAHHLGMGKRTVYTYLSMELPPTAVKCSPRNRPSTLNPYKSYLRAQWNAGHRKAIRLFEEIHARGYEGNYASVARFIRTLKLQLKGALDLGEGRGPAPLATQIIAKPLSPRRATWLIMRRPEKLTSVESKQLKHLERHTTLGGLVTTAQEFIRLVRQRLSTRLDNWLDKAAQSSVKAFKSFARGLLADYDAVAASVATEISNGQVEGQINRLKMLKRQMYGRAGLELLSKRLLLSG